MEKEDIISSGLLEMYVLGAASPEEAAQVERWRSEYPEVAAELMAIERSMESYASANAVSPASGVKDKIFASLNMVSVQEPAAKVIRMTSFPRMAAAAAVLLLVGSCIFNYIYYNKYRDADSKYQEQQQQLASVNQHLNDMDKDMDVVRSKYSLPVSLSNVKDAPDPNAAAKIFWMKNTGEVYVDPGNMPMAPQGMQYQLWAFVDGKPVDGGMITSKDGKTFSIQKMKTFGKAQAFAITLETAGGHPEPKGKLYVMGKI